MALSWPLPGPLSLGFPAQAPRCGARQLRLRDSQERGRSWSFPAPRPGREGGVGEVPQGTGRARALPRGITKHQTNTAFPSLQVRTKCLYTFLCPTLASLLLQTTRGLKDHQQLWAHLESVQLQVLCGTPEQHLSAQTQITLRQCCSSGEQDTDLPAARQ